MEDSCTHLPAAGLMKRYELYSGIEGSAIDLRHSEGQKLLQSIETKRHMNRLEKCDDFFYNLSSFRRKKDVCHHCELEAI